jgi:hypothetical protein
MKKNLLSSAKALFILLSIVFSHKLSAQGEPSGQINCDPQNDITTYCIKNSSTICPYTVCVQKFPKPEYYERCDYHPGPGSSDPVCVTIPPGGEHCFDIYSFEHPAAQWWNIKFTIVNPVTLASGFITTSEQNFFDVLGQSRNERFYPLNASISCNGKVTALVGDGTFGFKIIEDVLGGL